MSVSDPTVQEILVRPDWQTIDQVMSRQRRHTLMVFLLGTLAILALIGVTQRTVHQLALESILVDGCTWGIVWGMTVWYALRYRLERTRVAITVGALVALTFAVANLVPKWNVSTWIPDELASSPILYWGVWHLLIVGVVWWLMRSYPREMRAIGLSFENWQYNLTAGVLGGGLLVGHYLFTVSFAGAGSLSFPSFPSFVWRACFEAASSLGTALFFRGAVYRYFERERRWGYWESAITAAIFNLSIFVAKIKPTDDILTVIAVSFYSIMIGMVNAALYRWTRNLLPCYISALMFSLGVMLGG